jgi:uncharacterized membrane protein YgcG
MKRLWAYPLVAAFLVITAPPRLNAREPKAPNPCRELERDLDSQVNTLHKRQDAELAQCRQTYGKDDYVCRYMKVQQKFELQQIRDQRQDELSRCRGPIHRINTVQARRQNESCDTYDRNRNPYPHDKYPNPPYKEPPYYEPPHKDPPKHPPVAHNPPEHDGGGRHHRDSDAGTTRNAGASSGSSHSSGSSSSSSGSGGSSSSSYHSSSGSSNSSSGGSSYSSHSGSAGSSSSGASSSSSSSSSHSDSGGSRPK